MDFEPLPEQKQIIELRNKNLIVSASAGSGKTTVMIERICKLIAEENVSPKSLLVLTYTKSAGSEMKQKLYNALRKKSANLQNYSQTIDEVATADISTIHSFCSRLIKKYFHILGVSPSFEIFDEGKAEKIKKQILNNCLTEYANSQFESFSILMKNFAPNRKYDNIIKIILDINNYTKNYLTREEFFAVATTLYQNPKTAEKILNDNLIDEVNMIVLKLQSLISISNNLEISKYIEYLNKVSSELCKVNNNFDFVQNYTNLINLNMPSFYKDKNVDHQINNEFEIFKTSVQNLIAKYKKKNYGNQTVFENAVKQNLQIIKSLIYIEQMFYSEYAKNKHEKNVFDYSDLEELAIILCENPTIQNELKQQYKYVFIDEYQDANQVQEKLLSLICGKNNRFMVGDVKQSIYRFRGSKPEIFQNFEKLYKTDKNSQAIKLSVNFRSDKQILNFVNFIFEKIMTETTCGINFKDDGKFENISKKQIQNANVSFIVCDKSLNEKPEKVFAQGIYQVQQESQTTGLTDSKKEGVIVAEKILELLNEKIVENNIERNIRFSDITILVRKRGESYSQFCDALTQLGVPIYASTGSTIMENPEAQRFVNLLKTCLNFKDDIPVVSTLVSFFDFDETDLKNIKTSFPNCKYFYENIICCLEGKDALCTKVKNAYETIQNLKWQIGNQGAYSAINQFFVKTGYYLSLQAKKDETRLQVVKTMLNELKKDEFNFNLANFVDFVTKGGKLEAPKFSNGDNDFVNITTIHSSKGLEYPIVFVVDSGSDFTKTAVESLSFNQNYGIGLKYYDTQNDQVYDNFVCDAIKTVNAKEEFAEKLRVLYVALTRPKNKLYIIGTTKLNSLQPLTDDKQILNQKSFLDLMLCAFDINVLKNLKANKKYLYKTDEMFIEFEKISEDKNIFPKQKSVLFGKGDDSLEQIFKQKLESKKHKPTIVALKNSVSTLASDFDYSNKIYTVESLTVNEHLRTNSYSAEQGTNFHKVLELIDYDKFDDVCEIDKISKQYGCDTQKVQKALKLLNSLFQNQYVFKENKFIMRVPYNSIVQSQITDKIMVQGIIDAFSVDDKGAIIVDFKLTSIKSPQAIKKRYQKQLDLYEMAIKNAYNVTNVSKYILSLNTCELIKLD